MLMGVSLHSSGQDIQASHPVRGGGAPGTFFMTGNEEPTGMGIEFSRLYGNVVSNIEHIPSFSGIPYNSIFGRINEAPDIPAEDIVKLNEILSNLKDQQFFDFCMQQSCFPRSVLSLKSFCEKLGIYNTNVFNSYMNLLLESENMRKHTVELFDSQKGINWTPAEISPELSILHEEKKCETIKYFKRTIIEFDGPSDAENISSRQLDLESNNLLGRLFRFIYVLQELSIRLDASHKEDILASSGTLIIYLTKDVLDVLKRRTDFMKNVRYFEIFHLAGDIELMFPNPENLIWIEISSGEVVDLRGRNMDWILRHKGVEVLIFESTKLLFDTKVFKNLNQLKDLKKLVINIEEETKECGTESHVPPDMEVPTVKNQDHLEVIDLDGVEKLQHFCLSNLVLESVTLQYMPVLFYVGLDHCDLNGLYLQNIQVVKDVALVQSSFCGVTINNVAEIKKLSVNVSSCEALSIQHDSPGLTKIGHVELTECLFGSVDLQGAQSIEKLTISGCDLSYIRSIWGSLGSVGSLKELDIGICKSQRLPYEISKINGLEILRLDLKELDSIGVGEYTEGSGGTDLSKSFRLPETLQGCFIKIKADLVGSIQGSWFEKCETQLRLMINNEPYMVTSDYQIERIELGEKRKGPSAKRKKPN